MESFSLDREIARLILLQRIELITPFQKKIRKFFGRYFFTNFFSKYFINSEEIGKNYFTELAIVGNVKNTLHDINQYLKNTLTSKESVKAKKHLEHIAKNNWTVKKKKLISKTLDDKLKKPLIQYCQDN